ncbi:MAG: caspase family protein [Prevotellaceae bacterium]|nr:caspase family protein [Prevotellaceae bacterium]
MYNRSAALLLAVALLMCVCLGASAKVYLVSAGIADYPGTANDLRLPAQDAKLVTWLYTKNNSTVYCQLLNSQATQSNILNAISSTFAKAGADDIVVFFFSGHGYPGGFVAYDGKMDYETVRKAMRGTKSKHKIMLADACYAGKISTTSSSNSSETNAQKADVMLFLSSRSTETSIEKGTMNNGIFTTCLVKGLRGGADTNRDRTITAKELFNYVHEKVVKYSGGKQHPVMWGKFSDNMPVMKW